MKKSFGGGSERPSNDHQVEEANKEDSSWPSSLIARNISYEVPLKSQSAGINIRKMIRRVTVKLAGKKVSPSELEDSQQEAARNSWAQDNNPTTIRLLDHVDVHFRRGRMTCLMGTSGAGKVRSDICMVLDTQLLLI